MARTRCGSWSLRPVVAGRRETCALTVALFTLAGAAVAVEPNEGAGPGDAEGAEGAPPSEDQVISDEVFVVGEKKTFAKNVVTEEMVEQQSAITSVLAVVDNLPGVLVNEGDVFGTDDWSTTISIRGFQISLDEQQIGITIDGVPNGNSNYGGGAKANRFVDTLNLFNVEVSQGTADIASRSNEALGGTLNFQTQNPEVEERLRFSTSIGDYDARKFYVRYDTGELAENTFAWVSYSTADNKTWIDESGEANREHAAFKIISQQGQVGWTGYFSWDDTHEDNYQRISLGQFETNPDWDRLTGEWTGVPYIDQLYRPAWSTLRENILAYVKADFDLGDVNFQITPYAHHNEGRGDWVPPYIVDVVNDGGGPETEIAGGPTLRQTGFVGLIHFVDPNGVALQPREGCVSSITFPYGGAGPQYDPACYDGAAIPVGSYRHTHYAKDRFGITADFEWETTLGDFDNTLRGGLWWEDYHREEYRDWHKIIDSRVGFRYENPAYWRQYDREFPVDTTMLYVEDSVDFGALTLRLGLKQFYVDLERVDNFLGGATTASANSDSDPLVSGGLVWETGVEGLEVFAGYAENFAAIKDTVLERDASTLDQIEPETATNIDLGVRYASDQLSLSATYYDIDFDNRITFIPPDSPGGIDFLIGTNGSYLNVGGIESSGVEVAASYELSPSYRIFGSFTSNDSTYLGSGSAELDAQNGITPGNTVFGSVEEQGVLSLDWRRDDYRAGLSTKYVGERWIDLANTGRVDSFLVTDFYAGVSGSLVAEWLRGYDLHLTVNNLFDERYIGGVAGGSGGWIGGARTAVFTLTTDF